MTNKERYQRVFSTLHASDRIMEVRIMKKTKRTYVRRFVPVLTAIAIAVGTSATVYAADVGGIRRAVQIWIHGDQTNAVMEINDGSYTMTYTDKNGEQQEMAGGGVVMDAEGGERPMTEEELMEIQGAPDVEYDEDGTVTLYYHNQSIDITDRFEDGVCRVTIRDGKETLYVTVKYNNGFSWDRHTYPDPSKFNVYP